MPTTAHDRRCQHTRKHAGADPQTGHELRGLRDSSEGASGSIGNVVASVQLIKKLDIQLQQSVLEFIKNLASAQESMQDAIADYLQR
ncbi:MAG: hypothetical protein ACLUAR_03385 [Pilosibacter sp.]